MKNQMSRIVIIIVTILFAAYAVSDTRKFKLGPDLTGGTILVYRVQDPSAVNINEMMPAIKNRLDPAGLKNFVIRPLGNDRIEIVMPEAKPEEVKDIKYRVSTVGQLEFRIVADRRRHSTELDMGANAWEQKELRKGKAFFIPYGVWVPIPKVGPNADPELIEKAKAAQGLKITEDVWFRPADSLNDVDITDAKNVIRNIDGTEYVASEWSPGDLFFDQDNLVRTNEETGEHYVLMYTDQYNVTGEYLTRVDKQADSDGRPALGFNFNDTGATLFRNLTTEFKPDGEHHYRLGIILDGRLRSAPSLNAVISASGIITGQFTDRELSALERVLESGKLPGALEKEPVQERTIGPSLGEDTIRSGEMAIAVSFIAVVLFTVVYYRVCGLIAVVALFLNLLFTIALMVLFSATWTLPGLAGLVLTVGMAVDSNVLIFERIREELELGRPLGMAIRAGYDKAWGTIFDSNLTTILTALILFVIGSDQVKGFAITLTLGILTSMFSAVFVTRVIFEVLYEKRWIRTLKMTKWMSNPNIDFLKWGRAAAMFSIILIGVGIAAVAFRGWNILDIDFTGGTAAGLQFKEPTTTGAVREIAAKAVNNPSVTSMTLPGETPGTRFLVRTDERDVKVGEKDTTVRARLAKAFEGRLTTVSVAAGAISDVPTTGDVPILFRQFAGGKSVTLTFSPPQPEQFARQSVSESFTNLPTGVTDPNTLFAIVPVGEGKKEGDRLIHAEYQIASKQDLAPVVNALTTNLANSPLFDPYDQFGSQVAQETQIAAILAMIFSWLGIIIYVWFRFRSWTFGVAGVVALVHDVLVATGLMAIFSLIAIYVPGAENFHIRDMRINLDIIAALLTLIGFSINDTIVIFDRIREIKGKSPKLTREMVHRALNVTLSRTIITSLTVFMVVVVLFLVGGEGLYGFSFVLVAGVLTGTYSTIYIACPLVLALESWRTSRVTSKSVASPATVS
jgi:SecD/SecF fusion protein